MNWSLREKSRACHRFEPSLWRPNICRRCFCKQSAHSDEGAFDDGPHRSSGNGSKQQGMTSAAEVTRRKPPRRASSVDCVEDAERWDVSVTGVSEAGGRTARKPLRSASSVSADERPVSIPVSIPVKGAQKPRHVGRAQITGNVRS